MNNFGTLLAWVNGWINHTALPAITKFIATLIHDELPVAEQFIETVADSITADLAASKPLVALGQVISVAAAKAATDGVTISKNALAVAAANLVDKVAGTVPVTEVDASNAINQAAAARDAAIAKANAEFEAQQKALNDAADKAAAELKAKVTA